jgi:hypothetical protein
MFNFYMDPEGWRYISDRFTPRNAKRFIAGSVLAGCGLLLGGCLYGATHPTEPTSAEQRNDLLVPTPTGISFSAEDNPSETETSDGTETMWRVVGSIGGAAILLGGVGYALSRDRNRPGGPGRYRPSQLNGSHESLADEHLQQDFDSVVTGLSWKGDRLVYDNVE